MMSTMSIEEQKVFDKTYDELISLGGGDGHPKHVWVSMSSPERMQEKIDEIKAKKASKRAVEKEKVLDGGEGEVETTGGDLEKQKKDLKSVLKSAEVREACWRRCERRRVR